MKRPWIHVSMAAVLLGLSRAPAGYSGKAHKKTLGACSFLAIVFSLAASVSCPAGEQICATDPNVVFCEDFEDGSWLDDWYYGSFCCDFNGDGKLTTDEFEGVICGGKGYNTNCAAYTGWSGGLFAEKPFTSGAGFDELYVRWYVYLTNPFIFDPVGNKNLILHDGTRAMNPYVMTSLWGSGMPYVIIYDNGHTPCVSERTPNVNGEYPNCVNRSQNMGNNITLQAGKWYLFEWYVKLNSPGVPNGVTKLWVDEAVPGLTTQTLRLQYTDVMFRDAALLLRMIWLSGYENTKITTPLMHQRWDQIVISKKPIGPIGSSSPPPPSDTQPPSAPTNLAATAVSSSEISLNWAAATDNVGVSGYKVFRGSTQLGTSTVTSFTDQGLQAATTYTYTVSAFDQAGNESLRSSPANATTLPATSGSSTTVVLTPQADTFISADTVSYAASTSLNTYTWPDQKIINAILMKFDLSRIPPGAAIQDASLNLYLIESDSTSDATYRVTAHKVVNKNPDLNRATGATYDGVNGWTPNASYNNFPMAQSDISMPFDTVQVDKSGGFKVWKITPLVEEYAKNPSESCRILLNSDDTKLRDRYRFFASSEHANASLRPFLSITYRLRPAAPTGLRVQW